MRTTLLVVAIGLFSSSAAFAADTKNIRLLVDVASREDLLGGRVRASFVPQLLALGGVTVVGDDASAEYAVRVSVVPTHTRGGSDLGWVASYVVTGYVT